MRSIEADVAAASDRLGAAAADESRADAALRAREAAFSALLPLMVRLARYPAETVLAVPAPPDQALEGLLITGGLAVEFNREAAALRAQRAEAARIRSDTARQKTALYAAKQAQAQREAALERIVIAANAQVSDAEAEGRQAALAVAALAAQTRTLRDAIAAMDAAAARGAARAAREAEVADQHRQPLAARAARARQAALTRPDGPVLPQSAGRLLTPVAGPVSRNFGTPAEDGPATGMTYQTEPGSFVFSPCGGRVAFAAPFRSYGQLLIVECGGGYDMVLAGLGRIDVAPGHAVHPGDTVGRMPSAGPRPALYLELRERGQPVDPRRFLAPFRNVKG